MKLIKVKNGLLETENFFLVSSFSDFAEQSNVTRDISTGKLKLISNNKIERLFPYDEFVIELEKENFIDMGIDDYSMIYLSDGNYTFGIREDNTTPQNKYWKILRQDNHIQAYSSSDGINYTNIGGMEFSNTLIKQGFMKYGSNDFILNNYKLYNNPYVTLQNFPENTLCELYDSDNNLIKMRLFDASMECKVYLDSNSLNGHLVFKDKDGKVLYTTSNMVFEYGDVWVISPYNFEIIYLGDVITNISPALLQDLEEVIVIKNVGDKAYIGVVIGTQTSSTDLIELSLDGIVYASTLIIDVAQSEEKQLYVKITKNVDNHNFKVRDFQLVINE